MGGVRIGLIDVNIYLVGEAKSNNTVWSTIVVLKLTISYYLTTGNPGRS